MLKSFHRTSNINNYVRTLDWVNLSGAICWLPSDSRKVLNWPKKLIEKNMGVKYDPTNSQKQLKVYTL